MKLKNIQNKNLSQNDPIFSGNVFKKLIPWFLSIAIYFTLYTNSNNEDLTYVFVKLLPMISLCLFVFLSGLSATYSKYVFYALIFSTIGDALLVFKE